MPCRRKSKLGRPPRAPEGFFVYSECGEDREQNAIIINHVRIYSNVRPFSCVECEKSFKWNSVLNRHLQKIHGHHIPFVGPAYNKARERNRTERSYFCDVCDKSFKLKRKLAVHLLKHFPQTLSARSRCPETSNQTDEFLKHLETQSCSSPERFDCAVCHKSFELKSSLVEHVETHFRRFICSECGKAFGRNCALISHVRLHHIIRSFSRKSVYKKKQLLLGHMRAGPTEMLSQESSSIGRCKAQHHSSKNPTGCHESKNDECAVQCGIELTEITDNWESMVCEVSDVLLKGKTDLKIREYDDIQPSNPSGVIDAVQEVLKEKLSQPQEFQEGICAAVTPSCHRGQLKVIRKHTDNTIWSTENTPGMISDVNEDFLRYETPSSDLPLERADVNELDVVDHVNAKVTSEQVLSTAAVSSERSNECSKNTRTFSRRERLIASEKEPHVASTSGEKKFLPTKRRRILKLRSESSRKLFTCNICSKTFKHRKELRLHKQMHLTNRRRLRKVQGDSSSRFSNNGDPSSSCTQESVNPVTCFVCNRFFPNVTIVLEHIEVAHSSVLNSSTHFSSLSL